MTELTRWVILDDSDDRLKWSEGWSSISGQSFDSKGNYGRTYLNTLHSSNANGASFSFTFTGNAARIMGTTDLKIDEAGVPDPDWECVLDDQVVERRDPFPYFENNWVFCDFKDLAAGEHTIGLRVKMAERSFLVDQVQFRPTGTVVNEVVAATRDDADLVYSSGWAPLATVAHNTMVTGSTATFKFFGTSVSLWAMYPSELPHLPGQGTYTMDGSHPIAFVIHGGGDMSHYNRKIFEVIGLSREAHTLVMTYTSTNRATPLVVGQLLVGEGTNIRVPASNDTSPISDPFTASTTSTASSTDAGATISANGGSDGRALGASRAGGVSETASTDALPSLTADVTSVNPHAAGASAPAEHGSSDLGYQDNGAGDATKGSRTSTGAIVGAVFGALALVLLILGVLSLYRRRRKPLDDPDASPYTPFSLTAGFQDFRRQRSPHSHEKSSLRPGASHGFQSTPFSATAAPISIYDGTNGSIFQYRVPHTSVHPPYFPPNAGNMVTSSSLSRPVSNYSSMMYYHQDSGIRLYSDCSESDVVAFPPVYTPQ